jgi:hypothetical protein
MGFKLHMETDGNLCAYDYKGINYWCAGPSVTGPGPYKMYVEADGNVCFYNGKNTNYWCLGRTGPANSRYRLTMQDNGAFATYDINNQLIGTISDIKKYPFPIQPACIRP